MSLEEENKRLKQELMDMTDRADMLLRRCQSLSEENERLGKGAVAWARNAEHFRKKAEAQERGK